MDTHSLEHRIASERVSFERPTIAVLTYDIARETSIVEWQSLIDASRERNLNLICYPGQALRSQTGFRGQANMIYELVNSRRVHGCIVHSGGLSSFVGQTETEQFCRRYQNMLPTVSLEVPFYGVPSVLMGDYEGIKAVVGHLIQVHGYRRIGFIRGPAEHVGARRRYQGYVDALAEHGFELDPALVSDPPPGHWGAPPASLLESFFERSGLGLEAVVAASDSLALGLIQELRIRGVRVPDDIAVCGFDDALESRAAKPPMTTVNPAHYEKMQIALDLLMAQLRGDPVPAQTTIPPRLMVRRSCGCAPPGMRGDVASPSRAVRVLSIGAPSVRRDTPVIADIAQALGAANVGPTESWANHLVDIFTADIDGSAPNSFLPWLDETLRQIIRLGGDISACQEAMIVLRRHAIPLLADHATARRARALLRQARVLIGEEMQWTMANRTLWTSRRGQLIHDITQSLLTTFDMKELVEIIARELPRLGIKRCYLSLYESPKESLERARVLLAIDERGRIDLGRQPPSFAARDLLPEHLWPQTSPYVLVVEPLYFKEDHLGFALFDGRAQDAEIYDTLRMHLSNAVKGALLVEQQTAALRETRELFNAAQGILGASGLSEICENLLHHFRRLISAEQMHLFLLDHEKQSMLLRISQGELTYEPELTYDEFCLGIGGVVLKAKAPVLSTHADDGIEPLATRSRRKRLGIGPLVVVPLMTKGEVIGTITAANRVGGVSFSRHDVDLLMALATQAATAIRNVLLFEEGERARQLAESATRAKSEFLANMSHELRTPLNAVIGMMDLVLSTELTPKQRDFAETARLSGQTLLALVTDLLDLSKIEAGKIELESQPLALSECVERAIALVRNDADKKGLRLSYTIAAGTPNVLLGDMTRLQQILLNLLSNAVKFTEVGQVQVTVSGKVMRPDAGGDEGEDGGAEQDASTEDVEAGAGAPGAHAERSQLDAPAGSPNGSIDASIDDAPIYEICFVVRDTGIGIPAERIDHVFQAFHQVDASTTRRYGGTGLGLTISKQLCELMGGSMWVESKVDVGSSFYFTITAPAAAELPNAKDSKEEWFDAGMAERLPLRILLAEDNAVNQKLLLYMLDNLGYRADVASNGLEALAAMDRRAYDVVLLDVQMPEMDGIEVARRVCQRWELTDRPHLIAITANATRQDVLACLDAGMDDYVSKPVRIDKLVAALDRCHPNTEADELEALLEDQELLAVMAEDSEVLNHALLDRLFEMVGKNSVALTKIIETFLREAPNVLKTLAVALAENDVDALRMAAHSLKSSSASLGAVHLSELCREMEASAVESDVSYARHLLPQIEAAYAAAKLALEAVSGASAS